MGKLAELAHTRHTKSAPPLRLGIGEFQDSHEKLHVLRYEFLCEASRLHPEMLDELLPAAAMYRHMYEKWQRLQMKINPHFRPTARWPAVGAVIRHLNLNADCMENRPIKEALGIWAARWRLLDAGGHIHAWVLDMLWVTFFAWMVDGRPKVFHTCFLAGALPRESKTISTEVEWDPSSGETEDAVLQKIISESKQRIGEIRARAKRHFTLTSSIQPVHLTWAVRRHFDQWSYERMETEFHIDARTAQNKVTALLREIGLGQRRGRPAKNSQN